MVEKLQTLLSVDVPMQFEPLVYFVAAVFLLFLISFFADMLKLFIIGR